jgi:hypothetical protein
MASYEDPRPPWTAPANPPLFVSLVCSSHGQPAVIRFRFDGSVYEAVGASRQRPGSVLPSDGRGAVHGSFTIASGYAGCPHCGADDFVRCGHCHELGCWDSTWEVFHCPRCGRSGPVEGTIDGLSGLGTS